MKTQKITNILAILGVVCLIFTNLIFAQNVSKAEILEESLLSQIKKVTAADGLATDQLGWAVSVSGDTAIIGANSDDVGANSAQGSAYVFQKNSGGTNNWGQVKQLVASDGGDFENFGGAVSISGDTVVVGAYQAQIGTNVDQGAVYIFERNAGGANNWSEVKKLTGTNGDPGDNFGYSVSISGDTIVVGARNDTVGTNAGQGSAYIFERNNGGANNWGQVKRIAASDGTVNDIFGQSAAISGDTVIVGAVFDDVQYFGHGSAYIFERNTGGANNWGEVKKLDATGSVFVFYLGWTVAISGDTAVVGCPRDFVNNFDQGAAYVYQQNSGGANNWGQVQRIFASDGGQQEFFGISVSIFGDTIAVGDASDAIGSNTEQGSAYTFERNSGGANNWGQTQKLLAADGAGGDQFGNSVAISGSTIVAGSPGGDINSNNNQGAAYFF